MSLSIVSCYQLKCCAGSPGSCADSTWARLRHRSAIHGGESSILVCWCIDEGVPTLPSYCRCTLRSAPGWGAHTCRKSGQHGSHQPAKEGMAGYVHVSLHRRAQHWGTFFSTISSLRSGWRNGVLGSRGLPRLSPAAGCVDLETSAHPHWPAWCCPGGCLLLRLSGLQCAIRRSAKAAEPAPAAPKETGCADPRGNRPRIVLVLSALQKQVTSTQDGGGLSGLLTDNSHLPWAACSSVSPPPCEVWTQALLMGPLFGLGPSSECVWELLLGQACSLHPALSYPFLTFV